LPACRPAGRQAKAGDTDETGCGLVGSTTFCLFSPKLASRPPEDVYAVHCCWELEQKELLSESSVDAEEAARHESLLRQWRGGPLEQAVLVRVAKLSKALKYPRRVVGLARATRKGLRGYAILDGDHSVWCRAPRLKKGDIDAYEALLLRAHVGRHLLRL